MSSPPPPVVGEAARPFRRAAVLGSGVMGSQIAAHLANAGLTVELLDLASEGDDRDAVARRALDQAARMNPAPFVTPDVVSRVRVGNLDDHLDRLADVDWVIEVVIEDLAIKRDLLARIAPIVPAHAIVSSNTSGLSLAAMADGLDEALQPRVLGTHFFNPPRYLALLELIPTPHTDPAVLERVARFGRLHLGKGVVVAKDTPNFIANRIGTYAAMQAFRQVTDGDYTIDEVDRLTGRLVGHPKSATFRTADLVGLDVLSHVAAHLHEAVPDDESREAFRPPWLLAKLIERGSLGAKTREGFYKKVDGRILTIDPDSMEYAPGKVGKLGDLDALRELRPLAERLRKLYEHEGRAGAFFRKTTLDLLGYSARRLPGIADCVADVDRAMELGFGWELGPFRLWDALGFARVLADLREAGIRLPPWIHELEASGATGFYAQDEAGPSAWSPATGAFAPSTVHADEIDLAAVACREGAVVWSNDEAELIDLGEGVACYRFRSKMNSLGRDVVEGLIHCIGLVEEGPWQGLVVGNEKDHFSVGANLAEVAVGAVQGRWKELESGLAMFQEMGRRIRYAAKPVVVATQGRVLGGACEITMWCPRPVLATESYVGLVEIGVGLIPAGGGTTLMTAMAAERAASAAPEHVMPHLRAAFETVAKADVATSAQAALARGLVAPQATITMNAARRLWVARQQVLHLAEQGWRAPAVRTAIPVMGRSGRGMFDVGLQHLEQGGFVNAHLAHVAQRIGWVMTGGDLIAPATLHEDRLLELEREVFLSLIGQKATQQMIAEILTRNQPKVAQMLAKGLVNLTSVFRRKPKSGA